MAFTYRVVTGTAQTSGATQNVTTSPSVGSAPDGAIVFTARATAHNTAVDDWQFSFGAANSTTSRWQLGINSEHAQISTDTQVYAQTDEVVGYATAGTSSPISEGDITAFITDGVTITWGNQPTVAFIFKVIFIWTDGYFRVGNIAVSATQNGTATVTGLPAAPDVIVGGFWDSILGASSRTHVRGGMGMCYYNGSTFTQFGTVARPLTNGGGTATHDGQLRNDRICGVSTTGGAVQNTYEITAVTSDGFTITTRDGAGPADSFWYIAFTGATNYWLGTVQSPASNGSQSYTGPAFRPQGLLGMFTGYTALNTARDDSAEAAIMGFGATDGTVEGSAAVASEEGVGTTNTQSLTDNKFLNLPSHNGGTGLVATSTLDADGFDLNWTGVNNGQYIVVLAIKEDAVSGDPEGPLVGGKLIHGGILAKGRLAL